MENCGSQVQFLEQTKTYTGVGAEGYVPPGRSHHLRRTQNWGWRVNWSKILSLTRIPSHEHGGHVGQSDGGDGGGGGGSGGHGGVGWGPRVGDFVAFCAELGEHSASAAGLPQTPEGHEN